MKRTRILGCCLLLQGVLLLGLVGYSIGFEIFASSFEVPILVSKFSYAGPRWAFTEEALQAYDLTTLRTLSYVTFASGQWHDAYERVPGKICCRAWRGHLIATDVFVDDKPARNVAIDKSGSIPMCQTELPFLSREDLESLQD